MNRKSNLFDLMQLHIPEDDLCEQNCSPDILHNVKHHLFNRKGVDFMKIKICKIVVAAVLTIMVLAGGTIGVDAATGGHLMKKITSISDKNAKTGDQKDDYHYKNENMEVNVKKYNDDYDIKTKVDKKDSSAHIIIDDAK